MSIKKRKSGSAEWLYPENKYFVAGKIDEPVNVNEIHHNLRRQNYLVDVSSYGSGWLRILSMVIVGTGFIGMIIILIGLARYLNDVPIPLLSPGLSMDISSRFALFLPLLVFIAYLGIAVFMGRILLSLSTYGQNKLKGDFNRLIQEGTVIDEASFIRIETVYNTVLTHNITYRFRKPDSDYQIATYQTHAMLRQQINGLKVLYVDEKLHTLI